MTPHVGYRTDTACYSDRNDTVTDTVTGYRNGSCYLVGNRHGNQRAVICMRAQRSGAGRGGRSKIGLSPGSGGDHRLRKEWRPRYETSKRVRESERER